MKRFTWAGLFAIVFALTGWSSAGAQGVMLPQGYIANTDDALATTINPAGLGVKNGLSLLGFAPYYGGDDGKNGTDWGFSVGVPGIGFTGQYLRNQNLYPDKINLYSIGFGGGDHGVYLGWTYNWSKGIDHGVSWDYGVLYRPLNSVSVGAVARNLNNPRINGVMQDVGWDFGIALRPIGWFTTIGNDWSHRVTLLADANMRRFKGVTGEENYGDNLDYKFGAQVEIVPGVTGHFDFSPKVDKGAFAHDNKIWGGLTFDFGNASLGVYQRDAKNDAGSGVLTVGVHELFKDSWLGIQPKKWVEIRLNQPIVDYQPMTFSLFAQQKREMREFTQSIKHLGDDPSVEGIVLKLDGFSTGFAKLQEIRDALLDFKAKGKKIVVYAESYGNGGYYLANVADKIYLSPASELELMGFAAEMYFLRGTFDKIGIEPELEHIGAYKSYSDMFTRSDMSAAQKEATDALLDDYYKSFVQGIADGRTMFNDDVRALIDKGPFTSQQAYDNKLVDSLVYEDQIPDLLKGLTGSSDKPKIVREEYALMHRPMNREWDDMRKKTIAIVYASGQITSGESSDGGLFGSESMGSKTMVKALAAARKNKDVAAIVLRVDSPGGSGLASEMILREVERCRTGDDRKPVIVSMSDVAGSGGYYIACSADTIVAEPGTITGSIGVVAGKFNWKGLQEKIGLNTATLKRGNHADAYSMNRPFTQEERDQLRDQINQFYQDFVKHVSDGRGMDTSAVNKIGQGRIWSGTAGKDNGLVDVLGGLDVAIDLAARAAGIEEDETFDVRSYPSPFGEDFDDGLFETQLRSFVRSVLPTGLVSMLDRVADETRYGDGEILFLMPYKVEVK